jgi:hypothetical protein
VRPAPILAAAVALLAAGCGEQRTPTPDVQHADPPKGFKTLKPKGTGIRFSHPTNWTPLPARLPFIGGARSKTATLAVWRYPRTEPPPRGRIALEDAMTRLIDSARVRNPTFAVRSSEVTRIGGARGIELTGTQFVAGFEYRVRSAHLFKAGAEIVVDAYAPPDDFPRVDETVFRPVLRELRVTRP